MRSAVSCAGLIFYLCLSAVQCDYEDDSLQAAINAVSQRRRAMALAQAREYEADERGPPSEALGYLDLPSGDVRLEGPGYNYQMLLSQGRGPYSKDDLESQSDRSRSLEEALSEYINSVSPDEIAEKRSAFRELSEQPEILQRLGARSDDPFLTSFRERAKPVYEDRHRSSHEEDEREYLEEYLDALNDAVNTYLQNTIPLEKNYKDKRQDFDTGYDFFNSPLPAWKRGGKYAYGINLYDDQKRPLEKPPKIPGSLGHHIMRKRLWRDGSVDKGHKRVLKRSSKLVRSKKDARKLHEKTDPNVAKELSGIFMTPKNNQTKNKTEVELKVKLDTTTKPPVKQEPKSKTKQKLGQKEEATNSEIPKPIAMSKKSIDWSDYFGIDRRRKKSVDDNWLLDQYLQAYARENQGKSETQEELEKAENYEMLMDSLREAADAIIAKAVKYTGAHEGIRNEQVIDKVREQVMNQLALAYDLENIRRILEEHRAEQEPYRGISEAKKKRVTVKKEKAADPEGYFKVDDNNNKIENTAPPKLVDLNGDESCAEVNSRIILCRKVISSNHSALIIPCVIHSFCSTCSKCPQCEGAPTERQCDVNFLDLADNVCGESRPFCRYSARHVLPSMKNALTSVAQKSEPSCDLDGVAKQLMECTQNGTML
nr:PREDICTED: uncharacterized protein LOC109044138 [Bemisia tabaci]